jgi:hypothetical protein
LSTPIAVTTALVAALLFGISSVADQRSTKKVKTERALSPRILLDLVRQPLWLIAILTNIAGFALQVIALSQGSLAVVQPLLVFDLVFAVLIARSIGFDAGTLPPGTKRWDPVLLGGVGAATAGVAGFLAIGRPSAGHTDVGLDVLAPLAIGLVVVVGGCLVVAARNQNLRPLALALACGVNYGVAAFAVKLVTSEFGSGPSHVFTNWPIYVLAVVGPVGFILNQDAFQEGKFLAPVQSIITTADPIISIGLSILWLGVVLRSSPAAIFGEVASLLLMTVGIVITAGHSPQVAGERKGPRRTGSRRGAHESGAEQTRQNGPEPAAPNGPEPAAQNGPEPAALTRGRLDRRARDLRHGQRLDRPVEPVAAWASDLHGVQRPLDGPDRVAVLHHGWKPAPYGAVLVHVGRAVQERHVGVHRVLLRAGLVPVPLGRHEAAPSGMSVPARSSGSIEARLSVALADPSAALGRLPAAEDRLPAADAPVLAVPGPVPALVGVHELQAADPVAV